MPETKARDEKEFATHLRRDQSRLYGYIHSLVRDLNDTDDLFQQTATILWKKFPEFDEQSSFLTWACGVARYEVANFLRSRSRSRLYFSDNLNLLLIETNEELANEELEQRREALSGCVDGLRERDRDLLLECYAADSRVSSAVHEVAARSGRSPQSIYNSLRRIRRALYECVERSRARGSGLGWTS